MKKSSLKYTLLALSLLFPLVGNSALADETKAAKDAVEVKAENNKASVDKKADKAEKTEKEKNTVTPTVRELDALEAAKNPVKLRDCKDFKVEDVKLEKTQLTLPNLCYFEKQLNGTFVPSDVNQKAEYFDPSNRLVSKGNAILGNPEKAKTSADTAIVSPQALPEQANAPKVVALEVDKNQQVVVSASKEKTTESNTAAKDKKEVEKMPLPCPVDKEVKAETVKENCDSPKKEEQALDNKESTEKAKVAEKVEAKVAEKVETKAEEKTEEKVEAKVAEKTEAKTESKTESKVETKTENTQAPAKGSEETLSLKEELKTLITTSSPQANAEKAEKVEKVENTEKAKKADQAETKTPLNSEEKTTVSSLTCPVVDPCSGSLLDLNSEEGKELVKVLTYTLAENKKEESKAKEETSEESSSVLDTVKEGASKALVAVKEVASSVADKAKEAFSPVTEKAKEVYNAIVGEETHPENFVKVPNQLLSLASPEGQELLKVLSYSLGSITSEQFKDYKLEGVKEEFYLPAEESKVYFQTCQVKEEVSNSNKEEKETKEAVEEKASDSKKEAPESKKNCDVKEVEGKKTSPTTSGGVVGNITIIREARVFEVNTDKEKTDKRITLNPPVKKVGEMSLAEALAEIKASQEPQKSEDFVEVLPKTYPAFESMKKEAFLSQLHLDKLIDKEEKVYSLATFPQLVTNEARNDGNFGNNRTFKFTPNPQVNKDTDQLFVQGVFASQEDLSATFWKKLPIFDKKTVLSVFSDELMSPQKVLDRYQAVLRNNQIVTEEAAKVLAAEAFMYAGVYGRFNPEYLYSSNKSDIGGLRSLGIPISPVNLHGFWPNPYPSLNDVAYSDGFVISTLDDKVHNPFAALLTREANANAFWKEGQNTGSSKLPTPLLAFDMMDYKDILFLNGDNSRVIKEAPEDELTKKLSDKEKAQEKTSGLDNSNSSNKDNLNKEDSLEEKEKSN